MRSALQRSGMPRMRRGAQYTPRGEPARLRVLSPLARRRCARPDCRRRLRLRGSGAGDDERPVLRLGWDHRRRLLRRSRRPRRRARRAPRHGGVPAARDALVAFTPPSSVAPASVVVDGSVSVSNFPADQLVHFTTPVAVTGPLTDAQLRAAAVSVSGPLTDAQLRAAAVVVDGSAVVQPVSGPL